MLYVLIDALGVIIGSLIGLIFGKHFPKQVSDSLNKVLGLGIFIIGLNGVISVMFHVEKGALISDGEIMLVVACALGMLCGELINLDKRFENMAIYLEKQFRLDNFAVGFINASTLFCIGAMGIIGSLNAGLSGDGTLLIAKTIIDGVLAIFMAASLGKGVLFSSISVLILQGLICMGADSLSHYLQGDLLNQLCMVGYAIVVCIGFNFITDSKIRTVNMLPALAVPILYSLLQNIFSF